MSSPPTTTAKSKTLVVLGATGNQGSAVLRFFAAHPTLSTRYALRGITRNPSSPASQSLAALGVEMIQADADSGPALRQALAGATHIFANTDSNQHMHAAAREPALLRAGQTPLTYAREIELRQGRNLVAAAAGTATLERIVWSSIPSPRKWSRGRLAEALMFDTKEDIADLLWAEPGLRGKLSVLLVGFYVRNAVNMAAIYCPKKRSDGVYEMALPLSGDVPQAHADVDSDVGSWTDALFQAPAGTTLLGCSESVTFKQWVEIWAATNNVQGRYRQLPREQFVAMVGAMGEAMTQSFEFVEEQGLQGGIPNVLYPEDLRKQGISIQTTPLAEAMKRIDWSGVL